MMQSFANPKRFLRLANRVMPWAAGASALLLAVGLYLALVNAPQDYQQGETVRIMFVHVPAAWMALVVYSFMALAHGTAMVFRHPLADLAAKAAAPAGSCFTFLALATGALWGRPMWGTWWQWGDARLTSMFVLLLLYLGYLAVWQAVSDEARAGRIAAIVAIVGFINVPVVKFSVDWWSTLHQPASVFRADGPRMPGSILTPLFVMFFAFTFLFLTLHLKAMHTEVKRRRIATLQRKAAQGVAS